MGINIRQKGQSGEREIADMLNFIIYSVMKEMGFPDADCIKGMGSVQRNQNQSAVGGNDLTGTFGLSIEVKRQEQLSVGTWWRQCCASAERFSEVPVLLYRQNRKPWRCMTYVWLPLQGGRQVRAAAEFSLEEFKAWFKEQVRAQLLAGYQPQS